MTKNTAWVRLGILLELDKNTYQESELKEEVKQKLKQIPLPKGISITGESYIPDGQVILNGKVCASFHDIDLYLD